MHMQIERNKSSWRLGYSVCMAQTWGLQKVGFETTARALYPLDSPDVLEDSNQMEFNLFRNEPPSGDLF